MITISFTGIIAGSTLFVSNEDTAMPLYHDMVHSQVVLVNVPESRPIYIEVTHPDYHEVMDQEVLFGRGNHGYVVMQWRNPPVNAPAATQMGNVRQGLQDMNMTLLVVHDVGCRIRVSVPDDDGNVDHIYDDIGTGHFTRVQIDMGGAVAIMCEWPSGVRAFKGGEFNGNHNAVTFMVNYLEGADVVGSPEKAPTGKRDIRV